MLCTHRFRVIVALLVIAPIAASAQAPHAVVPQVPQSLDASNVRGAVYISSGAYNAPQYWKEYSDAETDRDFGYANSLHRNALRMWSSYEFWSTNPKTFEHNLDSMLTLAKKHHLRILFSLFESDGSLPTPENTWTKDPQKAFAIQSPGPAIATVDNKAAWEAPRVYLTWFMKKYRNDDRFIAIEVMNEPKPYAVEFAKSMLLTAKSLHGTVPLTMGTGSVREAKAFASIGLDVINFHDNFPANTQVLDALIEKALALGKANNAPVWITEWQRLRPGGSGWGTNKVDPKDLPIDYASMAGELRKYTIGSFFWSLMVKPNYLQPQREKGSASGIFWPDGTVSSLRDARAIANDPGLNFKETPVPKDFAFTNKIPK